MPDIEMCKLCGRQFKSKSKLRYHLKLKKGCVSGEKVLELHESLRRVSEQLYDLQAEQKIQREQKESKECSKCDELMKDILKLQRRVRVGRQAIHDTVKQARDLHSKIGFMYYIKLFGEYDEAEHEGIIDEPALRKKYKELRIREMLLLDYKERMIEHKEQVKKLLNNVYMFKDKFLYVGKYKYVCIDSKDFDPYENIPPDKTAPEVRYYKEEL